MEEDIRNFFTLIKVSVTFNYY